MKLETPCVSEGETSRMNLRVVIIEIVLMMGVELQNRPPGMEWSCVS